MRKRIIRDMMVSSLVLGMLLGLFLSSAMAAKDVEIITLNAGTSEVEQAWGFKWAKVWNQKHPDIRVKYELVPWPDLHTKVLTYIAAGTPPDLAWYFVDQITDWHKMGVLEPLDEWLGDSKYGYLDALLQPGSDNVFDGKMYGAPFTLCAGALAVRLDRLEEAGIDVESLKTWEDIKIAAKALTNPKENQYATQVIIGEPRMVSLDVGWLAVGNNLSNIGDFRPERKENFLQLLHYLADLFPYMPPAQVGWVHRDSMISYAKGVVAMYPTASYFFGEIKPLAPDVMSKEKTRFIPIPYGPKRNSPLTTIYTVGYTMFKDAKHKKEAAEFLKFWISNEVQREFPMNLCPKKGVTVDDRVKYLSYGEEVRWFEEQFHRDILTQDTMGLKPVIPGEQTYRIFTNELIKLFRKQITPEQMYENVRKQVVPLQKELE